MDASKATELAKQYADLRKAKRQKEQDIRDIAQQMEDIAGQLWMFLDDNGTTFLKGAEKVSVRLGTLKVKAWWRDEHDAHVREWLGSQGYTEAARGKVHHSTRCAVVKDLLEQQVDLPQEIQYKLEPTIVVRDDR